MKLTIVSGSHRNESQSAKIARYLSDRFRQLFPESDTYRFELANNPLPLWDESIWNNGPVWQDKWIPVSKEFQSSSAFVWVVPEWNGMLPSGVVNLLQLCGHQELGHKPALIVSVSASRNGVYPITQMRMNTCKNNRMVYIPEHVIVRDAPNMLNDFESAASDEDRYLRERLDYSLKLLESYSEALTLVRKSDIIDHKSYPNGM